MIAEARRWVGARFYHQGRTRTGVDCLGLLIGVAEALGLLARDGSLFTTHDQRCYSKSPDGEAFRARLGELMWEIAPQAMQPGDVVLFTIDHSPQHLGILSDYPAGGLGIIHAYAPARRVVEHRLDDFWRGRIAAVYSLL